MLPYPKSVTDWKAGNKLRLYQKAFVFVFASLIILGITVSLLLLKNQYDTNLHCAEEIAIEEHGKITSEIEEQLRERSESTITNFLTKSELDSILLDSYRLTEIHGEVSAPDAVYSDETITVVSYLTVGDRSFSVSTEHKSVYITDEIGTYVIKATIYCALAAMIIALIASFCIYRSTADIPALEQTVRKIAAGKYDTRAKVSHGEMKSISIAVNDMAEAVENSMGKLSDIAESRKIFVDSMAHEMKTPLTSILCMGDLLKLKKDVSEKDRRDYAGVIVEEAKRMKELSFKLLSIASTDNASLTPELSSTAEIMDEISSALTPVCQKADVKLFCEGVDGIINVDRELIKSLFANLIDNALKASSPGKIIGIRYAPEGQMMKIIVADQGIGMKKEDIKRATEPFYMADKARSRKAGGAGLGLSLCASIAKKHNATIDIKSELGKGTIVIVAIPLAGRRSRG